MINPSRSINMKSLFAGLLVCAALAGASCLADDRPGAAAPMSDAQRLDTLIRENQRLVEENTRLSSRPQSREEAFAICMQAAQGQTSPMAAESIGEHCDQLLKR
jgi:hypothetical protein